MTISQTLRFDLYRWSEDTDSFTRSQMDISHANIEERAARFISGTALPSSAPEYARSFFYNTVTGGLFYYDAEDGTGTWQAISASDPIAALIASKGDLIAGTGSGTADNLPVGSNSQRLIANSAQPMGLAWASDTVNTVIDAKGDLLVGQSADTVGRLASGPNNSVLVANSASVNGVEWTSTLTSTTIASGTLTNSLLNHPKELWSVSASSAGASTINLNTISGSVLVYTSASTANWTINIRGDASTTLNSMLNTNEAITVAFIARNGGTAYRHATLQIDGSTVTPFWQGGASPTAGNASSYDAYTFSIVKTGASSYLVFAAQTRFGPA